MLILPAIDILDNRAVRLMYGKRDKVTDYGSPLERAELWQSMGAKFLHLVDLNGAFDGTKINVKTIKEIIKTTDMSVQLGGGIKSLDIVKLWLEEVGVTRIIIGSALVTNRDMAEKAFALYGDKIACGIDAKDGKVYINGWVNESNATPTQLALDTKSMGAKVVIYTDISRDGALGGVNVDSTVALQKATEMNIVASGGMSNMTDIEKLRAKGVYGAILGRSIYERTIDLTEAIRRSENGR